MGTAAAAAAVIGDYFRGVLHHGIVLCYSREWVGEGWMSEGGVSASGSASPAQQVYRRLFGLVVVWE